MEHQLYSKWVFWFDGFSNKTQGSYGANIVEMGDVTTAETFWGVYDAIPLLSKMENGSDVSLFKKGIKPIWEDDMNVGGGRVQIILIGANWESTQKYWRDVLLTLIGETMPDPEYVNGVAFSVRQHCKISVWVEAKGQSVVKNIAKKLKEIVNIEGATVMYYPHDSTLEPIIC
ncbi:eukaryotic translation initiation factor 4E-2, putative [Entamoeba invadens IP1]|uniref:eukaryotic translation initiation factor 4E-2, putative n=1 Tax=Entamoeba invadens IP1 TaxID=370355 RepID=UPI0002C3D990|nr:eukaryotic translation initiation factor 4E-2, putative [Entamoeba invadens IP1]ELP94183.1 eukaryotic translation initiation factor 4E-2, putative [Entamoeba invadens IP1]|eukprot:XP_004260954.1 eukaryotic translation initiation factor 4E-2, putative [Entamoeba invadens IP1]